MINSVRKKTCWVVAFMVLAASAFAEPVQYTPDKWHTRIYFTVQHMGLSNFQGRFKEFDIRFMFDEANMANSSVAVTVPVSSIDTFSPELNSKMPNEEFFEAENYPEMTFVSTNIEQLGAARARMTGDLTIKDITLPVTFDVNFNKKVLHPFSRRRRRCRSLRRAGRDTSQQPARSRSGDGSGIRLRWCTAGSHPLRAPPGP